MIAMTVKRATEQLFFIVVWMFFVSHFPWFRLKKKKGKPELKGHTSIKLLVFHNCPNGCQIMQLGLVWAFITSTKSLQMSTTYLILAVRGIFPLQCSRGVCSQVSSLIIRSRGEQNRDQSRSVAVLDPVNTSLHLNRLLVAVWLTDRTLYWSHHMCIRVRLV